MAVYRLFNYFVAEREPRPPAEGKFLAMPYATPVAVSTFFATPFWFGEIVTVPETAPELGEIFLVEGSIGVGEHLSLARVEKRREVELVIQAVELKEPVIRNGQACRYAIQEGYGERGTLIDCIRSASHLTAEGAIKNFENMRRHLVSDLRPRPRTIRYAVDAARWEVLRDVFGRTIELLKQGADAANSRGDRRRLRDAFAREVYRRYRVKRIPVVFWPKSERKLAKRHPSKEDRLGRAIVVGHTRGNFGDLKYSEIRAELEKQNIHVTTEAVKKKSNKLGLPSRKPGPPPRNAS